MLDGGVTLFRGHLIPLDPFEEVLAAVGAEEVPNPVVVQQGAFLEVLAEQVLNGLDLNPKKSGNVVHGDPTSKVLARFPGQGVSDIPRPP